MANFNFDDHNINWYALGDLEHIMVSVLNIEQENKNIDVLVRFEAHKQIILHRHKAHNNTFVVQGEHHLYHPDGQIKEIRPVGSYTSSPADNEPHRECGGDDGAIVLFSIRGEGGVLYEVLDDDQTIIGTLAFQDIIDLAAANQG